MAKTISKQIEILDSLAPLAAPYDGILCDVWGVVHNGVKSITSACDALITLRAAGKTVLLLSNAPRPGPSVAEQISQWGVPEGCYDGIVTSGDGTRHLLRDHAGQSVFHLGPARDLPVFEGLDVSLTTAEKADLALCTGLYDDNTETPEDYADILGQIKARNLPMICANPDILVERGDRLVYCAGAIAKSYADLGGKVTYAGKPYGPIYELAMARLDKTRGKAVPKDKILCIGDGIKTDMEGAFRAGLDAVFVASGLHIKGFDETKGLQSEDLTPLFDDTCGLPRAAQVRLKW